MFGYCLFALFFVQSFSVFSLYFFLSSVAPLFDFIHDYDFFIQLKSWYDILNTPKV